MTLALFQVVTEPKTIHSKADIGPGSLYLARMIVQTDSSVQETFNLLTPHSTIATARSVACAYSDLASCAHVHAASRSEYE